MVVVGEKLAMGGGKDTRAEVVGISISDGMEERWVLLGEGRGVVGWGVWV